jgi:ubiquinone/menaquinone biosynthesis C-methylase UbiE
MMQQGERKPGKADPSRAKRVADYSYKKGFYQSRTVADDYDFHRWGSPERARRNAAKWRTILAALAKTEGVGRILDLPCGTGRFTDRLVECGYEVVAADISLEMMQQARSRIGSLKGLVGFLRADAEQLPFQTGAVDCVMSIRFLFHVDPVTRIRMLKEMARISRRWLILDYRHKYSYRYAMWRIRKALRLTTTPLVRVSRAQLEKEARDAGLRIKAVLPVARVFSDKWVVLCETTS